MAARRTGFRRELLPDAGQNGKMGQNGGAKWRQNAAAKWVGAKWAKWVGQNGAKWVSLNCAISYSAKQMAQFRLTHFLHFLSATR
jgi:hypothetical protein